MSDLASILAQAAERGRQLGLSYSGALTPTEVQSLREQRPDAVLVDVRSAAEWQFVGVVPDALRIELRTFPGMQPNPNFVAQLSAAVPLEATVLFMCRSGVRSDEAARLALSAGYTRVYNVLEGFEGDKDEQGHRGTVSGWKAHGLPWQQG
jgi:rhodanese-related sulfurtransferase